MRIAVTGGKGFVGSHVADWAERAGHEVYFFDRRDGHNILGDLSPMEGADAVIHLAGVLGTSELFDSVTEAIAININGSYRVAQWCANLGVQYVGILVPDVFPSIYCATKMAAKRITDALHKSQGLRVAHVTAFNAHGPGQAFGPGHPRKFGPTFSVEAWNNRPIPIWGDGLALVDPVPVGVVGRMLVDACNPDNGDNVVFDGGLGIGVTVNEIAHEVLAITGSTAGIRYEPMRRGETPTNVPAIGRGWNRLDWIPSAGAGRWRDDLADTVNWYKGKDVEVESGLR